MKIPLSPRQLAVTGCAAIVAALIFFKLNSQPAIPSLASDRSRDAASETATTAAPYDLPRADAGDIAAAQLPSRAATNFRSTPSATPERLWAAITNTQGAPLPVGVAVIYARQGGRELVGRSASIDPTSFVDLANLRPGETVALPLFDGVEAIGRVNLVQGEADNWIRVGGALTGGREGSFALNSNGAQVDGMILLPGEGIAVMIEQQPNGAVKIQEKPLDEVLCTPMPLPPEGLEQPVNATGTGGGETLMAATIPLLSSRPTATAVLYIDFDGETVTDSRWASGQTIVAAPANLTAVEISQAWASVTEDFWAFNIDVTTDVNRYNNAPANRRTRCIVTPTDTAAPGSGGVAYVNSFSRAGSTFSATIPCWVFVGGAKPVAEAVSHEVGHTLGLRHDARAGENYYAGHGSGAVGWAPIMGVGYYRALVQWSKGEYAGASNLEDDIAIISSSSNGFSFAADDAGNSRAAAAALNVVGTTINQTGFISQSTDSDFYRVIVASGTSLTVTASPAAVSPNVDLLIELQDSSGTLLASGNPDTALNASFVTAISGGTYFISVRGTGRGSVTGDGYSSYGAIGAYTLTGTLAGAAQAPTLGGLTNQNATAGTPTAPIPFTVGDADTNVNLLTVSGISSNVGLISNANISFGGSGASRTITLLPTTGQTGTATITVTVNDGALTTSANFVVTVSAATVVPVFTNSPASQTVTVGASVTFTAAATGTPAPTYQWAKNGSPLAGATGTSFTIAAVSLGDAGNYTVIASNSAGSVPSSAALLTVNTSGVADPARLSGTPIGSAPYGGSSGGDKFKAFDGNTNTAFDSEAAFIYVGLDLGSAKTLSRVRYFPRAGFAGRMLGARIRGANSADLSDAVTLYTISSIPPDGKWQDVAVTTASYRYVFFTTAASGYGNVAELEFYGASAPVAVLPMITSQPQSQTVNAGEPVAFAVTSDTIAVSYQWFKNGGVISGATGSTLIISTTGSADAGDYVVVVTGAGGSVSSNPATLTVLSPSGVSRLIGTPIGSAPYGGSSGADKFKAFDGNTGTSFDSEAAFIYVGLDFGSAKTLTRVRYFPRGGFAGRMVGGLIRGANSPDLSDAVTLYSITTRPPEGTWQEVTLPSVTGSYRYVFFTTPASGYGNVAELEFHGGGSAPVLPQITSAPQSQTVNEGEPAVFTVATDVTLATYQWFKNGNAIPGATSATYRIATVLAEDAGSYTVMISASGGSVTSVPATLTVQRLVGSTLLSGTPIGSAPYGGSSGADKFKAFDGNTGTSFDSEAAFIYVGLDFGSAKTITRVRYFPRGGFAGRMLGALIRGANSPDLSDAVTLYTITTRPPEGTWQDVTLPVPVGGYRYVFFTTPAAGYGNVAELEFHGYAGAPASLGLLNQPQSQNVQEGAAVSLSAGVTGEDATYQWYKDGTAIPGATSAVYFIEFVLLEDAGVYTVAVTHRSGEVTINLAVVTVRTLVVH